MRILLVEDESELACLVRDHLVRQAFTVDIAGNLADARALINCEQYDAVVLDRSLPDGDGLDMVREKRSADWDMPVLAATAMDRISDRVSGLDTGLDDYLVKPYDLDELTARLRALLRRPGKALSRSLQVGNLVLDTVRKSVEVNACPVLMARRQIVLLEMLMRSVGRVVARSTIEAGLYSIDEQIDSNAIDANVSRLRKQLIESEASVRIHTVRGVGYMMSGVSAP